MSKKKARPRPEHGTELLLTDRALRDLLEIEEYSIAQFGKRTAARYLADIDAALERLKQEPSLLKPEPEFHPALSFYRVNKHLFVCDAQPRSIVLLAMVHASRDIPSRLAELEPALTREAALLHAQLAQSRGNR